APAVQHVECQLLVRQPSCGFPERTGHVGRPDGRFRHCSATVAGCCNAGGGYLRGFFFGAAGFFFLAGAFFFFFGFFSGSGTASASGMPGSVASRWRGRPREAGLRVGALRRGLAILVTPDISWGSG